MALLVTEDIPYGNAAAIDISCSNETPIVSLAAHPHGGPESLWFCFRLSDDGTDPYSGPVRWVLTNTANMLGAPDASDLYPVMRVKNGAWQRMDSGNTIEHPDGRVDAEWIIDVSEYPVDIALCFPYGMDEVDALAYDGNGFWHTDTIGLSQGGRRMVRLANDYGATPGTRPGIYVMSRQHSGETPGSWVLDGFLRRMAEAGESAPLIWTVPLTNIDGVIQGDYGKDNFPYDLNRAWDIVPMRHETQVLIKDMSRWSVRCKPMLALDFHAPGGGEHDGVYSFMPSIRNAPLLQETLAWGDRFCAALADTGHAAPNFTRIATYPSRWQTAGMTTFCAERLGIPSLSFETPYSHIRGHVLTCTDYRNIGACFAESIINSISIA